MDLLCRSTYSVLPLVVLSGTNYYYYYYYCTTWHVCLVQQYTSIILLYYMVSARAEPKNAHKTNF